MHYKKITKNLFNKSLLIKIKDLPLSRLFLSKSFVYGYCLMPIFFLQRDETETSHIAHNSICPSNCIASKRTKRHFEPTNQIAQHFNNTSKTFRVRHYFGQNFSPRLNDFSPNSRDKRPQIQANYICNNRQLHNVPGLRTTWQARSHNARRQRSHHLQMQVQIARCQWQRTILHQANAFHRKGKYNMGHSGFSRMHRETNRGTDNKQHKEHFAGTIVNHFDLILKQISNPATQKLKKFNIFLSERLFVLK